MGTKRSNYGLFQYILSSTILKVFLLKLSQFHSFTLDVAINLQTFKYFCFERCKRHLTISHSYYIFIMRGEVGFSPACVCHPLGPPAPLSPHWAEIENRVQNIINIKNITKPLGLLLICLFHYLRAYCFLFQNLCI